jgi:HEAT repeat protein
MSRAGDAGRRRALARHAEEEIRYRAVAALDPADGEDRAVLLERLADPSWRVRSAAVERLAAVADALPALLEALATGPTAGAREAAAAALARLGAVALPALVERLGAPDPDLRQAAAGVLGDLRDRRAVAPLVARLADADPNVRAAVAEALAQVGGAEAAAALRAAADSDDPTLRASAVEGLVELRASVPVGTLERLLADPAVRRPACRLLGACEAEGVVPLLVRGLSDGARSVREAALAALAQQRARLAGAAAAPLLGEVRAAAARDPALADAWAGALASEEPLAVSGAIAALAAAGAVRHVPTLLRLAEDDAQRPLVEEALEGFPAGPELRAALADALPALGRLGRLVALSAIARLGSPAALESLVREASDPGAYAQAEAIAALGRLGDARAVGPLAGLLGDGAPGVAGPASAALVHLAGHGGVICAAVLAALRDRAGALPSAALYRTLGALGGAEDLGRLRAGLRADAVERRRAAAAAVAALGRRGLLPRAGVPELAGAAADPAWEVRAAAAQALGAVAVAGGAGPGRAAALVALRAALGDREPAVRAAAAEALGACGEAGDAAALAAVAGDPDAPAPVVLAALHALRALGAAPRALVVAAARHADPEVVKEAVLAAARLPAPEGEGIVREAARSARWDVRQAAARAMAERGDPALAGEAAALAAAEPDPLVARAFAAAARALGAG